MLDLITFIRLPILTMRLAFDLDAASPSITKYISFSIFKNLVDGGFTSLYHGGLSTKEVNGVANKSGKSSKAGRNKASCLAYRNSGRREKNKARRIRSHLKRFPGDVVAADALTKLKVRA